MLTTICDENNHDMFSPLITVCDGITAMESIGHRIKTLRIALGLSQSELGKICGWGESAQGRVSNYESDSRTPKPDDAEQLARALKTSASFIMFGTAELTPNVRPAEVTRASLVPVVSWVTAGALCDDQTYANEGEADEWLPCPVPCGPHTYALRVVGESMSPAYRDGELIYVDPDVPATHGKDVVVRAPDGGTTFKRLQITPDGVFLLALNPDYPDRVIKVPADTHVCGVVIGSWIRR